MKTISIINLKGGVGKTVTSANMAHILAVVYNQRVLLVDGDKQGNLSQFYGVHGYDHFTVADILTGRHKFVEEIILPTKYAGLDIIPANMHLIACAGQVDKLEQLKLALDEVSDQYDYCIIDNAPDINACTINALMASDTVIIPLKIDKFAFAGVSVLVEQIVSIMKMNPMLNFIGCLVTSYVANEVNMQGVEWMDDGLPYYIFNTKIRRTEKVDESTFAAVPIIEYSPRCGAAKDYKAFVAEFWGGDDCAKG